MNKSGFSHLKILRRWRLAHLLSTAHHGSQPPSQPFRWRHQGPGNGSTSRALKSQLHCATRASTSPPPQTRKREYRQASLGWIWSLGKTAGGTSKEIGRFYLISPSKRTHAPAADQGEPPPPTAQPAVPRMPRHDPLSVGLAC